MQTILPIADQTRCAMNNKISLATTYDAHDPKLLNAVLPFVDFLEITPDSIAYRENGQTMLNPQIVQDLKSVRREVGLLVHGVGLSIGSWDGYSQAYTQLLDQFFFQFDPVWHSEHLGYTEVGGKALNTMLAVPRTDEMLELLIPRIKRLQARYGLPFLLENIVHMLPDYPVTYTDAAFLNILTEETGCGLILDLYNLECDAHNYNFDIDNFLADLNMDAVKEMHIAGGTIYKGQKLDIHSNQVAKSTLELTNACLPLCKNARVITFEILPQAVAVHGHEMVAKELERLSYELKLVQNDG